MKCIFRFKDVSKRWLSVVNYPSFARGFVSRTASPCAQPKHWTLLDKRIHAEEVPQDRDFFRNLYSSDVGLGCLTKFDLPAAAQSHGVEVYKVHEYIVAKDDNGLLLCGYHSGDLGNYYILNPITKEFVEIPRSKRPFFRSFVGLITQVKDSVVTSYKVIRLEESNEKTSVLKFDIFSSETGEWKDVDVRLDQAIQLVPGGRRPVVFNQILHFVDRELGILAYDPYKCPNSYRIIKLPEDIDHLCNNHDGGKARLFDVHQGYLRYFEATHELAYGFRSFSMWTLSDYEAGIWLLEHRVKHDEVLQDIPFYSSSNFVPVAFHPFDFGIVYVGRHESILSYNMHTRELIVLGNPVNPSFTWCFVHMFVLPLRPVLIQEAPPEVEQNKV